MKYAVLYESNSGNTELIAGEIFDAIKAAPENKLFIDLAEDGEIPEADVYYVGFPVSGFNCSFRIMDCLDRLQGKQVALFATCGLKPTEKYREKIESAMKAWIDDDTQYLGFYMCQGKTSPVQQQKMLTQQPDVAEALEQMFREGEQHPDAQDLKAAAEFAENTQ